MNYYETRLAELDESILPKEIFSDGRENKTTNDEYWEQIKVGDKVFPTAWFLRDMHETDKVKEVAANGLTVTEKGEMWDSYGKYDYISAKYKGCYHKVLFFAETVTPMNFKNCINQQIWKVQ